MCLNVIGLDTCVVSPLEMSVVLGRKFIFVVDKKSIMFSVPFSGDLKILYVSSLFKVFRLCRMFF